MSGRYLLGKSAKKEDEDEIMPQSKRAQDAKKSAIKSKKKGKKAKKVAKKPVAKKASTPKAKRPVKKTKRGKKWGCWVVREIMYYLNIDFYFP